MVVTKRNLALGALTDDVFQVDRHLPHVTGRRLDVHAARLDLRQIEDVVDQIEQVRRTR
jgi:hypothetical protein